MAPRRLRPLCCFFIAIVSHLLILTDLGQQGACNQGEKRFRSLLRQFGCTPHPLLILERSPAEKASITPLNPPKPVNMLSCGRK